MPDGNVDVLTPHYVIIFYLSLSELSRSEIMTRYDGQNDMAIVTLRRVDLVRFEWENAQVMARICGL